MWVVAFRFRSRQQDRPDDTAARGEPPEPPEDAVDDPALEASAVNHPVRDASALEDPVRDASALDDPVRDASALEDPALDDPVLDDPALDDLVLEDDEDGEWLAIELHEWASEARSMLEQLLLADGVVHSWQGTTLLTHESVEEAVDALIEEVESAEARELDPDRPQLAFEMTGWSGRLQAQLSERLGSAGVPHEFDSEGDLVCHEDDEEHVELLIEDIVAREGDSGLAELDGLEANNLLSAMFEATDRLRRDVHDSKGILGVVTHGQRLAATATPFGFSATSWSALREAADQLVELIESEESSDVEIRDLAIRLRDTLQRLV